MQGISKPIRYHMDFRYQTASAPSGSFVVSLFSPAALLVNFDYRAIQHQRRFIHQILLDQG